MKSSGAKRVMRQNKKLQFSLVFPCNVLALCYVRIFFRKTSYKADCGRFAISVLLQNGISDSDLFPQNGLYPLGQSPPSLFSRCGSRSFGPVERLLSDNMNNFDDLSKVVDISPSRQCRKRVRQPSNDARLVAKRARHSGGGKIPAKACKHDAEKLSDDDIMFNYTKFHSVADKAVQDQKILCSLANIVICCTQMAG